MQGLSKNDPDSVSSSQQEMRLCMCTDLILYLSGGLQSELENKNLGCFTLAHYNRCPDGLFDTVRFKSRLLSCRLTCLCSGFQ